MPRPTRRRLDFGQKTTVKGPFKKPWKIKKNLEKCTQPRDYLAKTNLCKETPTKRTPKKEFFTPNPITPDFKKLDSEILKKKNKQKKERFFGRWFRKTGGKPHYVSLEGETFTDYKAYEEALKDKKKRKKRIETEMRLLFGPECMCQTKLDKDTFSYYGIPEEIREKYHEKGVKRLYQWQVDCLHSDKVLEGRNLVYSAPTSGGKTLVAEVLMIRRMLLHQKKVLFVLPYVSLVQEKCKDLKEKLSPLGLIVKSLHSSVPISVCEEVDVVVCTIEKANLIVNKLLDEGSLGEFGSVVVDELHIVGEEKRGFILELLLTKLITVSKNQQIVCLSATLPNIGDLSKWLKAQLFVTDFRPVPLTEYIKTDRNLYNKLGQKLNKNKSSKNDMFGEKETIYTLCKEVVSKSKSVLIFCPTKEWCKSCSRMLTNSILKERSKIDCIKEKKREIVLEKLRQLPGEICPVLRNSIPLGVAYHHAGMTVEEREVIEGAFRGRIIDILAATSTLAAGVNLPAYRVIFRHPYIGPKFLSVSRYKQMSGRAGRAGIDSKGESIVFANKNDRKKVFTLINSEIEPVKSVLDVNANGMCRIILESVTSKVARTKTHVEKFARSTLAHYQMKDKEMLMKTQENSFDFLVENKFLSKCQSIQQSQQIKEKTNEAAEKENQKKVLPLIKIPTASLTRTERKRKKELLEGIWKERRKKSSEDIYFPTQFGNACFFSGLNPRDALFIRDELENARNGLVLKGSLHLCYLVTPTHDLSIEPNWPFFYQIFGSLSQIFRETARKIGVSESFLSRSAYKPPPYQKGGLETLIHRRFFYALLLFEIVNERPLHEISTRFGVERGKLQALQNSSSSFSRTVAVFCQRLNWTSLSSLIAHFCERVNFGVQPELLSLVQIPHVKAFRARALYDSGLRDVEAVARCSPEEIRQAISKYDPYVKGISERIYRKEVELKSARRIKKEAERILEERLEMLEEADSKRMGGEPLELETRLRFHQIRAETNCEEMEEMNEFFEEEDME